MKPIEWMRTRFYLRLPGVAFGIIYLVIALVALPMYFPWSSVNFILGMLGLPLIVLFSNPERTSGRFYWVAVVAALLSLFLPEKTVLFIALIAAAIAVGERLWGKLSMLALLTIALMTSTMQYLAGIFSFPLRLWLTGIAASILKHADASTVATGNVIVFNGHEYSVDPACMGVKMLLTSLLSALFIIAIVQKQKGKSINAAVTALLLLIVFVLNLLSNMVRILLLVSLNVAAGSQAHDLFGLGCFAMYVLLPAILLISFSIARWGHAPLPMAANTTPVPMKMLAIPHGILMLLIAISIIMRSHMPMVAGSPMLAVPGYAVSRYDEEILQYSNRESLVYIKRINGLLGAEHNPIACWLGSGYQFEQLEETAIGGVPAYTGVLIKGKERLYTAWWYDNGTDRTINPWEWRWNALRGMRHYSIINVTCGNKAGMEGEVRRIKANHSFNEVL